MKQRNKETGSVSSAYFDKFEFENGKLRKEGREGERVKESVESFEKSKTFFCFIETGLSIVRFRGAFSAAACYSSEGRGGQGYPHTHTTLRLP